MEASASRRAPLTDTQPGAGRPWCTGQLHSLCLAPQGMGNTSPPCLIPEREAGTAAHGDAKSQTLQLPVLTTREADGDLLTAYHLAPPRSERALRVGFFTVCPRPRKGLCLLGVGGSRRGTLLAGRQLEGQEEDVLGYTAGLPSRLSEELCAEDARQLPSAATELSPSSLLCGLRVSVTSPRP